MAAEHSNCTFSVIDNARPAQQDHRACLVHPVQRVPALPVTATATPLAQWDRRDLKDHPADQHSSLTTISNELLMIQD